MTTNVHLTPELERFARHCVESGRYNNVSEVIRSALRLLEDAEEKRKTFTAMLRAADAEADEKGTHTIEEIEKELDAIIAKAR